MGRVWRLEKQKRVLLSKGGLKKTGKTSERGRHVGVARVKKGVLHIVAPLKGFLVKHQKLPVSCQKAKKEVELDKK
mgnify:CR=1 FL=1